MKVAVNTSCAVAGGAITHLRHVLPALAAGPGDVHLVGIGTEAARRRVAPPGSMDWVAVPGDLDSLPTRLRWENTALPRILREIGADVLFHPANFPVYRSGVPQVTVIHNLAPFLAEVIEGESLKQRLRLRLLRRLTLDALRRSARSIFVSEWGKARVVSYLGRAVDPGPVIPFGCDHVEAYAPTDVLKRLELAPGEFVLTVSHFYRYKKLEHLIDAQAALGPEHRNLPLVIVGEPYDAVYSAGLRDRAKAVRGRVLFTGALGGADVATLMKACTLFVFTSEAENLPITLLEAMAAGCPIVTNQLCSMPETCLDAARYVDSLDAEGYRAAMAELLGDAVARKRLTEAALARARHYTWSRAATETLSVFRALGSRE